MAELVVVLLTVQLLLNVWVLYWGGVRIRNTDEVAQILHDLIIGPKAEANCDVLFHDKGDQ